MKIRTGFVSNSSASSFILSGSFEAILRQVAKMAELNAAEIENESCMIGYLNFSRDSALLELFQEGRLGIAFNSINYDTYITCYKPNTKFQATVQTCNNTNWSDVIDNTMMIKEHEEGDDDYCNIRSNNHELGRFFVWLSDGNKIRSADHYLSDSITNADSVINVGCKNKKCNQSKQDSFLTIWFDQELVARCTSCDQPLNAVPSKTRKNETQPDIIVGGYL